MAKEHVLNIDPEVFALWTKCRKHGDNNELKRLTGFSLPVIERALNVGAVYSHKLQEFITAYYTARASKDAIALQNLKAAVAAGEVKTEDDATEATI
jgi:hypothetical protein